MLLMSKISVTSFLISLTFVAKAQYCTTCGPSSNADSNVESVNLNGVSGGINHLGCPSQIGVEVYLNETTTLSAGSTYTLQVDFGTCGGNFAGAGTIWIDFDQSLTFTQNEVVGTWTGTPPVAPMVYNVSVPLNAHNGATRMRVSQQEAGSLPLNPCAAFQWGSVMDFGITIINGLDCSGFAGDDLANAIEVPTMPFIDTVDLGYCYGNQNIVYDSPDIFYKLILNPTLESIEINTCGSNFDTYLTVLDPQGQVIAYNDDEAQCAPGSALAFNVNDLGFVYVVVEGWGNETGLAQVTMTANYVGLNEPQKKLLTIFPNPSSDEINFGVSVENAQVLDAFGKQVLSITAQSNAVNVKDLSPGVYTLIAQKEGIIYTERFIKVSK